MKVSIDKHRPDARHDGNQNLNVLMADGHARTWKINDRSNPWGSTDYGYTTGFLGHWDYNWGSTPSKSGWYQFSVK